MLPPEKNKNEQNKMNKTKYKVALGLREHK
jgi:hypothetical protein